jgi:uncharacterized repeat protein (TIGR03803 family)
VLAARRREVSHGSTDGANPNAGLLVSGSTLFGTTQAGGSFEHGTVFALNFDGTGFTNLYNFTGGLDGGNPAAGLILSSNTLYGTTTAGGISSNGTIFALHGRVPKSLPGFGAKYRPFSRRRRSVKLAPANCTPYFGQHRPIRCPPPRL